MILIILQARMSSNRLSGKVLKPILGKPMLALQAERIRKSVLHDRFIVATSNEKSDDAISEFCKVNNLESYRGSKSDVLDRFYQAAITYGARHIMRLTGDCPLQDPEIIDKVIGLHLKDGNDYTSCAIEPSFPDGLDCEIFSMNSLKEAWEEASLPSEREHVSLFFYNNKERYKMGCLRSPVNLSNYRWTVDYQEDFDLVNRIYQELYKDNPNFTTQDILNLYNKYPELNEINTKYIRNEGLALSIKEDQNTDLKKSRYQVSEELLKKSLTLIPLGSQTFSKSITQYPLGVSPFFIKSARGCYVWDADGNKYIDFVNSLAAVTLGYQDPDVNAAVISQLHRGSIFTLPNKLEIEVAELFCEMVPGAEMVRYGKNGSDVTTGAIRLARAFTGREHIAICGYHGWHDWYIGTTTMNLGVPECAQSLSHCFKYNDIDSLKEIYDQFPGKIAAVIMEPVGPVEPIPGFLESVQKMCTANGSLLIFDETVTGFRIANGGAQEYFKITPDLATYGKGVANGFPLSVLAGRKEIMKYIEKIFFSFTFGGEALSLAASKAALSKIKNSPVIKTLWERGGQLKNGIIRKLNELELNNTINISGLDCWTFLTFKATSVYDEWQIKSLFLQEIFSRGVLSIGTHNMNYCHSEADIKYVLGVYESVFEIIKDSVENKKLEKNLKCLPIKPLMKLR